jgi:hydroxymethylpyrimidine/phosphomethylpyrimidine kinase
MVREQIDVLLKNFPISTIKTGLLCSAEIIRVVAEVLGTRRGDALVIDPVITATSGDPLLKPVAIKAYEKYLFPLATLITPNLHEAAKLLGEKIQDRQSMEKAAHTLAKKYGVSILLKGGHLAGARAIDLLCVDGKITEFAAPFVRGVATHGTGCTYSAAITAGLASDLSLEEAIERAKRFVTASIRNHFRWGKLHALNHSV